MPVDSNKVSRNAAAPLQELRALVDLAPMGFAVYRGGTLAYANPRFVEITGHTVSQPACPELTRLFMGEDDNGKPRLSSLKCRQCQPAATFPCGREEGEDRWVEAWTWAVPGEGEATFLCVLHDVTEQKRLEERMEHAGKLSAIGRLAGGIAHDFGNVLQVILGSCALAREHLEDPAELVRNLGIVEEASRRAVGLTRQLLAFGRRHVPHVQTVDLRDVVAQDQALLARILGDDVSLAVRTPSQPCYARVDTAHIQQVIMNLALNARDAMPGGGSIGIDVRRTGSFVEVQFSDSGIGMDEETMAHAFEPFFTTKEKGKGTGLGLSIVRGIVARSGGTIRVRSSPGAGTCFTIQLPRVEPEPGTDAPPREEVHVGNGRVLLVEDEATVRIMVRSMLERGGYQVTEADGGGDAIEICRSRPGSIDLVLTDLVMPGLPGTEVAARIQRMGPMPVLFMTGYSTDEVQGLCGDRPVILKPFEPGQLLKAVRDTIEQWRQGRTASAAI